MTIRPIRTLVADDSATFRLLVSEILTPAEGFEIVCEASDGQEAVRCVEEHKPDLVLMDIRMPRMDGFTATRRIMADHPTPVVIVTAMSGADVHASLDALAVGALTLLPKPPGPTSPDFESARLRFLRTLRAMAGVKVVRRWSGRRPEPTPAARPAPDRRTTGAMRAVGVAASTGGPGALRSLLGALPATFDTPILIVQHITDGFVGGLAHWLDQNTSLKVKVAEEGEPIRGRMAYLAPDDRHLGLAAGPVVALSDAPPIGGFRPSATHLFRSMAEELGAAAVALVLTGMGRDGVDGLQGLHAAGGRVLAQDEATSVVYGMPGAAVAEGLADTVLPLSELPGALLRHAAR